MTTPDNTATTDLADVPHPAGASHVAEWLDPDTERPGLYFRGHRWTLRNRHAEVLVDDTQHCEESARRFVTVIVDGRETLADLTAEQAPRDRAGFDRGGRGDGAARLTRSTTRTRPIGIASVGR